MIGVVISIVLVCSSGCMTRGSGSPPSDTTIQDQGIERQLGYDFDSETKLLMIEGIWQRYESKGETGVNYRKYRAETFRNKLFDRALLAYWDIHDSLPPGDVETTIAILESEKLLPFWPCDPETLEPVRIVGEPADVISWSDVFVTKAANEAFDYTTEYRSGIDPYSPFVETRTNSDRFYDLAGHEVNAQESGYDAPIPLPTKPETAFADLVQNWFWSLVIESFMVNGGQVPEDIESLLCTRVKINGNSWGTQFGPFDTETPGDFEYGVDPSIQGFYFLSTNDAGERIQRFYRFEQTEIDGNPVYDITSTDGFVHRVTDDAIFQNRIPILTDELFTGSAPVI